MRQIRGDLIRKSTSIGVIGMLILSMLTMMAVPSVSGVDVFLPASFYGDVTVNGEPAPVNTVVTGRIVDAVGSPGQGNITVTEAGKYGVAAGEKLGVSTDNENDNEKTIEFYIKLPSGSEGKADQTATFSIGGITKLNLTATVVIGTPPTITSYSPTDTTPNDYEAATRTFSVTVDQPTTVAWSINGTVVETDAGVPASTAASYTNGSAVEGYWSVSAVATNVTSGLSDTQTWEWMVEDITPPAKVTGLTSDTPTLTTVNLTWDASTASDFLKYSVYKNGALLDNTTNTYYNVTGLEASTTYYFNVSAWDDSDNEGELSAGVTITTASYPAPIIVGYNNVTGSSLSITVNEMEAIRFNATADQAITTWNWFRDGVNQIWNYDSFETCWSVNGTYSVAVNATNANGTSNTVTWTIVVNDITSPAMVTGLTNGTPSSTGVDLWWTANTEADLVGYRVYQDGLLLVTTANAYYSVTGLSPATTYTFNVSAYDDNALEGENATISVTTSLYSAPTITSYTISNRTIAPPQTTDIDVAFSEVVEAWIQIEDSNHNLVKELYHSSSVTNPTAKTWDGTYTNATVVPDGTYYVNVTGINATTGLSVVDNTQSIVVASEVTIQYNLVKNPGSTGKNWISIPLTTNITTASQLMSVIGSNCDAVNRWNPVTQKPEGWISLMGGMGTNFAIVPGEGYEVSVTANTTFSVTGAPATISQIDLVKKPGSTGKNWIGLPYDTTLTSASTVMSSIGSNCDAVNRWNPVTQKPEGWISLMGGMGTNFAIVTGRGYEVSVTGNVTWTPV
ncbi:MAG: fibronectin type III domain-containing protein [Methanocellales archaeon]|nr:fibronectin type III domain-containing protein [Methanocellales archaeon]MDD3291600.1 fibronectin type III domain-containing protein [Methanocellales archaeon]MDD5235169.1 fibronectin type III domain-containing protein [Methanocellales archaeon]MDD5485383.1 fibronectin type III domain-containing protein [Methanocellales archaeon]